MAPTHFPDDKDLTARRTCLIVTASLMMIAADPRHVEAFWKFVRTDSLPGLDQGPRAGVASRAGLEGFLRGFCREAGLGSERSDQVVAVGLLYHDHQDEAHDLVQDLTDVEGSLIHAIVHRREPDYWNAKYWFRQVGDHAVYRRLTPSTQRLADAAGVAELGRRLTLSGTVDPLGFVDACEAVARRKDADPEVVFLRRLQHAEFETLVEYLLAPAGVDGIHDSNRVR